MLGLRIQVRAPIFMSFSYAGHIIFIWFSYSCVSLIWRLFPSIISKKQTQFWIFECPGASQLDSRQCGITIPVIEHNVTYWNGCPGAGCQGARGGCPPLLICPVFMLCLKRAAYAKPPKGAGPTRFIYRLFTTFENRGYILGITVSSSHLIFHFSQVSLFWSKTTFSRRLCHHSFCFSKVCPKCFQSVSKVF